MLRTTRSTTSCSREPSPKGTMARAKSSCGTSANLTWSDPRDPTLPERSRRASCDSLCMARNFGGNGQSSRPEWERDGVRTGSCRRLMTNSPRQITTPKWSRHPRCLARFHPFSVDGDSAKRISPCLRDASGVHDFLSTEEFCQLIDRLPDLQRDLLIAWRARLRVDRIDQELLARPVHLRVNPTDEPITPEDGEHVGPEFSFGFRQELFVDVAEAEESTRPLLDGQHVVERR